MNWNPDEKDLANDLNIYDEKDQNFFLYMIKTMLNTPGNGNISIINDILQPVSFTIINDESLDYFTIKLAKLLVNSDSSKILQAIQILSSEERFKCRQTIYQLTI